MNEVNIAPHLTIQDTVRKSYTEFTYPDRERDEWASFTESESDRDLATLIVDSDILTFQFYDKILLTALFGGENVVFESRGWVNASPRYFMASHFAVFCSKDIDSINPDLHRKLWGQHDSHPNDLYALCKKDDGVQGYYFHAFKLGEGDTFLDERKEVVPMAELMVRNGREVPGLMEKVLQAPAPTERWSPIAWLLEKISKIARPVPTHPA